MLAHPSRDASHRGGGLQEGSPPPLLDKTLAVNSRLSPDKYQNNPRLKLPKNVQPLFPFFTCIISSLPDRQGRVHLPARPSKRRAVAGGRDKPPPPAPFWQAQAIKKMTTQEREGCSPIPPVTLHTLGKGCVEGGTPPPLLFNISLITTQNQ